MLVINTAISGEIQHVFPSKNVAGLVSSWLTLPPTWKFHAINMDQSEEFTKYYNNSSNSYDSEYRQPPLS